MRRTALAALLSAWAVPALASGAPPRVRVLPAETGGIVGGVVRSPEAKADLPDGWTFPAVRIDRDEVVIEAAGPGGVRREARLSAPDDAAGQAGLRFFSLALRGDAAGVAADDGLRRVAGRIDAAFPDSPWIEEAGGTQAGPRRTTVPPWLALALAGAQVLALGAGVGLALGGRRT